VSEKSKPSVGMIGLGSWALPIVQEPNRGRFPVVGHDIAEPALPRFAEWAARAALWRVATEAMSDHVTALHCSSYVMWLVS